MCLPHSSRNYELARVTSSRNCLVLSPKICEAYNRRVQQFSYFARPSPHASSCIQIPCYITISWNNITHRGIMSQHLRVPWYLFSYFRIRGVQLNDNGKSRMSVFTYCPKIIVIQLYNQHAFNKIDMKIYKEIIMNKAQQRIVPSQHFLQVESLLNNECLRLNVSIRIARLLQDLYWLPMRYCSYLGGFYRCFHDRGSSTI